MGADQGCPQWVRRSSASVLAWSVQDILEDGVISLLKLLDADLWVYDPYLTLARAAELGVRKVELDELLSQCPVRYAAGATPQKKPIT